LKFSKKKAIELYANLTGHSKSFLSKNIVSRPELMSSFDLNVGLVRYSAWKNDGRIYMQVALGCHVRDSYWFNLETLERDNDKQEKWDDEIRKEIREGY
jgi:hypothetical protein